MLIHNLRLCDNTIIPIRVTPIFSRTRPLVVGYHMYNIQSHRNYYPLLQFNYELEEERPKVYSSFNEVIFSRLHKCYGFK
jgi:hypothetical protein